MASILNSQSRDLKHGGTFTNHCEVIILSMTGMVKVYEYIKVLDTVER